MEAGRIESYVDQVYLYAAKRTFSREETEELAQEILLTAIRSLNTLQDEQKFEPWLWALAGHVTQSFRRRMGRQRAMFSYDELPKDLADESDVSSEAEEQYAFLRERISMLSEIYRQIIILYYYDGLSTRQIAGKLQIPEGTVTWRLSQAREKIKKECENMEESALRPVKMNMGIYGSGNFDGKQIPFPSVFIDNALNQNILYYSYESPKGVEELAKLCGVPAYYIEDAVLRLKEKNAVIEPAKGKFQTDFIIWSDKHGIYSEENAEKILAPIMNRMITALKKLAEEADKMDFYKAKKAAGDLFFLYGAMAFEWAEKKYCTLPLPQIGENYDGNCWRYFADMETAHRRVFVSRGACGNKNGAYKYVAYGEIAGIEWRQPVPMCDEYIDAAINLLERGASEDKDTVALAIREGYIVRKENGALSVDIPVLTKKQQEKFEEIAERNLGPLMEEYNGLVNAFVRGYKKLFPRHLGEDADRMCHSIFKDLFQVIAESAVKNGEIPAPSEGCFCDVLLEK